MNGQHAIALGLTLGVTASALAVVYSQHQSRALFVELQRLEQEQAELDTQWGRLELEQSTWATHGRIERLAREQLGMRLPDFEREEIVVLQ
ncbi:cell division protein FtsL [Halofilum ochraceum]|jgi:cell division protein FtsL|uniref:cell division protein FtsL n=1 Tax=Halofilum ochraceum TaxID=1611323 RepID=UPI0008DA6918|nr:cell division protein FtsL [Halofilum ochraceum]